MNAESSGASRAEAIAQQLRQQIVGGKYEAGDRLPSERDLVAKTGANRASVREALKQLELSGMISIRRGGGARVQPLEQTGISALPHLLNVEHPDRDFVAQWLDVWELVLAGAARLAVERGSEEELDQARKLLRRLSSKATTAEEFVQIGDEMTELIAAASRNVVLRMLRNGLTAQLRTRHTIRLELRPAWKAVNPIFRAIAAALEERDAVEVSEGVRRLIASNRESVIDLVAGPREGN